MDSIKGQTKRRIEELFDALTKVKICNANDSRTKFDLLCGVYTQLYVDMKDKKKEGGEDLRTYFDLLKSKVQYELTLNVRGDRKSQFMQFFELWETELTEFYRGEYADVEFTPGGI